MIQILFRGSRVLFILAASAASALAQGTFPPPSGPGVPLMKTLQQIEPRIDLLNSLSRNGVSTDFSDDFVISSPGSYYLSANLDVKNGIGILINTSRVTLDLNGFQISGNGGGQAGIEVASGIDHIAILNGSICSSQNGIIVPEVPLPRGCSFRNLRFSNCAVFALVAGESSFLSGCSALDCGTGFAVGEYSVLEDCACENGTGSAGISAGAGSSLTRCKVSRQVSSDINSIGISVERDSTLSGCVATGNTCNTAISVSGGCSLNHCVANFNTASFGISIGAGGNATNCNANSNTASTGLSGGFLISPNCNIQQCSANTNLSTASTASATTGVGFDIAGGGTVVGCTAADNSGDGFNAIFCILKQCTANGNSQFGIDTLQRCTVDSCAASFNHLSGIRGNLSGLIFDCLTDSNASSGILIESGGGFDVRNNTSEQNGSATTPGAGIQVKGGNTRVDGNHLFSDYRGIEVVSGVTGVYVIRNSVAASSTAFVIAAGNKVGVIVTAPASGAINGTSGAAGVGSTDPTANIVY